MHYPLPYRWLMLLLGCVFSLELAAQVRIDTSISVKRLVGEKLLGNRMKVRGAGFVGNPLAVGYFVDESPSPLIGEGIVLSTGNVLSVPGPNRLPNKSYDLGRRGDKSLEHISKGPSFDAAYLEFDFMPQMDYVSFNFVFASEEYTEYVNSQFNDVFAFYISGPGINGTKNLAVVPGSGAPITVNTVNHIYNRKNYIDNNHFGRHGQHIPSKRDKLDTDLLNAYEFDGFTTLLCAETPVVPGGVYHIRISIADVGDHRYDSAVFLEAKSFSSYPKDAVARAELMAREDTLFRRRNPPVAVGIDPEAPSDTITIAEKPAWGPADLASVKGNPWRFEFAFDSYTLTKRHQGTLDTVADYLRKNPNARLRIEGHTDAVGSSGYNTKLSQQRAESVRAYLLRLGIPANRTEIGHYGFSRPLQSNADETGRARNRRVEIVLLK